MPFGTVLPFKRSSVVSATPVANSDGVICLSFIFGLYSFIWIYTSIFVHFPPAKRAPQNKSRKYWSTTSEIHAPMTAKPSG